MFTERFIFLSKHILFIGICFLFCSFQIDKKQLPNPEIHAGIARLSGKIINFHLKEGEEAPELTLWIPNPITAENGTFKTYPDKNGNFRFEVPVECNITIGTILLNYNSVGVILRAGKEIKLHIRNDSGLLRLEEEKTMGLSSEEVNNSAKAMDKMDFSKKKSVCPMQPDQYVPYEIKNLEERLKIVINDSMLTEKTKTLAINEFKLYFLRNVFLDYKNKMNLICQHLKLNDDSNVFTPVELDKSYYRILKYFDLNNSRYLYTSSYPIVLQLLLANKTLNIPPIGDTPIPDWLKKVKSIMTGLVGFDTGLFYDVLAAHAYAWQLNEHGEPLSDKQKENIRNYFRNREIPRILLRKNEAVIKSDEAYERQFAEGLKPLTEKQQNSINRYFRDKEMLKASLKGNSVMLNAERGRQHSDLVINKTPDTSARELMDAIISRYKGKAVLVDFWATWCVPCMEAIKVLVQIKKELTNSDFVFVYIASDSSPLELWSKKIKTIGGEQYYITSKEWKEISNTVGPLSLPSFFIYNREGKLTNKVSGYPGREEMRDIVDRLIIQ